MIKSKLVNLILDLSYQEWFGKLWERLIPESQLEVTSKECKSQFLREENESLSSSIRTLSIVITIVWATTYVTDRTAAIIDKTLYFRVYYQIYLLLIIIGSFKGYFDSKSRAFNQRLLFFSFFQVCFFQGLITHYSNQSTVIFVTIANVIVSVITRGNAFQLLCYLLLSNGAYFYLSGDLARMSSSGSGASLLASILLFQIAMLLVPCTYVYQNVKGYIDLYNIDLALRKAFDLTLKTSEATSTFLSQNYRDRINYATNTLNLDYADAFNAVTQIRRRNQVVILYQDIRAFTSTMRISTDAENTIKQMMSESQQALDELWANASDKGDLVLAFFDETDLEANINLSLYSAFKLNLITEQTNEKSDIKIRRYPVLTLASCSTGNVASSRRRLIDCKGDAPNLAARIDEITKLDPLKSLITSQDIVMDEDYYSKMKSFHPGIELITVELGNLGLKIRDFEEHSRLYILKHSDHNASLFKERVKACVDDVLNNKQRHLYNYFKSTLGETKHE